jgi:hypothetical protein
VLCDKFISFCVVFLKDTHSEVQFGLSSNMVCVALIAVFGIGHYKQQRICVRVINVIHLITALNGDRLSSLDVELTSKAVV